MSTRAIPVVVERAPGGGSGWSLQVCASERFMFGTDFKALTWVRNELVKRGTTADERGRVIQLVIREMARVRRAEVTAEAKGAA